MENEMTAKEVEALREALAAREDAFTAKLKAQNAEIRALLEEAAKILTAGLRKPRPEP